MCVSDTQNMGQDDKILQDTMYKHENDTNPRDRRTFLYDTKYIHGDNLTDMAKITVHFVDFQEEPELGQHKLEFVQVDYVTNHRPDPVTSSLALRLRGSLVCCSQELLT